MTSSSSSSIFSPPDGETPSALTSLWSSRRRLRRSSDEHHLPRQPPCHIIPYRQRQPTAATVVFFIFSLLHTSVRTRTSTVGRLSAASIRLFPPVMPTVGIRRRCYPSPRLSAPTKLQALSSDDLQLSTTANHHHLLLCSSLLRRVAASAATEPVVKIEPRCQSFPLSQSSPLLPPPTAAATTITHFGSIGIIINIMFIIFLLLLLSSPRTATKMGPRRRSILIVSLAGPIAGHCLLYDHLRRLYPRRRQSVVEKP